MNTPTLMELLARPGAARRAKRSMSAFTLIELLVVIAIIAILAGILIPTVTTAMRRAEVAQARTEINNLVTAIKAYYNDYGGYPTNQNGDAADARYGYGTLRPSVSNNRLLISVLRSIDAPNNAGHVLNRRRNVYLEASDNSFNAFGDFIDPWGTPYEIHLDTGFNNEINNFPADLAGALAPLTSLEGRTVIAWSAGPDGQRGNADDIYSWR